MNQIVSGVSNKVTLPVLVNAGLAVVYLAIAQYAPGWEPGAPLTAAIATFVNALGYFPRHGGTPS